MIRTCPTCKAKNRVPANRLDQRARCGKCKTTLEPVDAPYAVATDSELEDLIARSPLPVLVDFWAAWCGPCRAMAPELVKLARRNAGRVVVAKVDTESLPAAASRYGIQSIPTMILFRGGREARRILGAQPAGAVSDQLGI